MVQHVDPDVLALLALGEDPDDTASADERDHLSACPLCADEVAELSAVALAGRALDPEHELVPPAPVVWDRISAELGLGTAATPRAAGVPGAAGAVAVAAPPALVDADHPSAPSSVSPPAPVVSLSERRERRRGGLAQMLVAACLALVLGVTAGVLWERRDGAGGDTPIASAQLDALPDWPDASGQARIEETSSGVRQVVLDLDAPSTEGGYREVWLIASDLSGLVSLGVLEGTEGRFDIPAGLDLEKFSLVDVSEEHFDGDPAHSGDSIVRGALENKQA